MKKLFLFFFTLLVLGLSNPLYSQFQQEEFIIGAWKYPDIEYISDAIAEARFQQVLDANFNLLVYPEQVFDYQYTSGYMFDEDYNDRAIEIAAEVGLKIMINDRRHIPLRWWDETGPTNTFNSTTANSLITHYSGHANASSIYGYHIKDEPSPSNYNSSHLPYVRSYIEYIKNNHNSKLGYINLLPYYDGYGFNDSRNEYEDYLDEYLNDGSSDQNPDLAGFDYYLSIKDTDYFYNLRIIREKIRDRNFWAYPYVRNSPNGFVPDNSSMRFSIFSPLAYGAKGLIYYQYEKQQSYTALASNGTTNTRYDLISDINSYISNVIGEVIMSSNHLGAYHKTDFKNSSNNTIETIPNSEKISSSPFVKSVTHDNTLVGQFYNIEDEAFYLLVVNKGYDDSFPTISTTIKLPGNLTNNVFTTSTTGSPNWNFNTVSTSYSNNETSFTVSNLLPGEGRLYKVTNTGLAIWDRYVSVNDNVSIPSGTKMIIKDNTEVRVANGKRINVYGELEADGVTFTASHNNWSGITFHSGSDGHIKNSTIEKVHGYGGAAIEVKTNNSFDISGNIIQDLTGAKSGVNLSNADFISIYNNRIEDVTNYGIYAYNSNPKIYDNFIKDFTNSGIYATGYSSAVLSAISGSNYVGENTISGGKYGLQIGSQSYLNAGSSSSFASQNRIMMQSGSGWAHIYSTSSYSNTAKYNYFKHYNSSSNSPVTNGSISVYPWLYSDPDPSAGGYKAVSSEQELSEDQILLEEAIIARLYQNYSKAERILSELLRTSSDEGVINQSLFEYAWLAQLSKEDTFLLKLEGLEKIFDNTSLEPMSKIALAKVYYSRKKYDKALKFIDKLVEKYPDASEKESALILASYIATDAGYHDRAETYYLQLNDLNVKHKEIDSDIKELHYYMTNSSTQEPSYVDQYDEKLDNTNNITLSNYPNPFNPTTNIQYSIPKQSQVSLRVFDLIGREVAVLVNDVVDEGEYSITFNGSNLSSGIYFYQLITGAQIVTKRMILIK